MPARTLDALAGLLLVALVALPAAAREIAITLDDLPYALPSRTSPSEGLGQGSCHVNGMWLQRGSVSVGSDGEPGGFAPDVEGF